MLPDAGRGGKVPPPPRRNKKRTQATPSSTETPEPEKLKEQRSQATRTDAPEAPGPQENPENTITRSPSQNGTDKQDVKAETAKAARFMFTAAGAGPTDAGKDKSRP